MNNLNLTEDDVNYLLHGDDIYNNENVLTFKLLEKKYLDHDIDKNYVEFNVKIVDVKTNIEYETILRSSNWSGQSEENFRQTWNIVQTNSLDDKYEYIVTSCSDDYDYISITHLKNVAFDTYKKWFKVKGEEIVKIYKAIDITDSI